MTNPCEGFNFLEFLPQRPPFLFIDRVLEVKPEDSLVAIKNITINEPFFVGHFPGTPVMPGVLILEALAQAGVILAGITMKQRGDDSILYFAKIDDAKFKRIVVPGDQLRLEVKITKVKKNIFCIHGVASVDGSVACSADMMSVKKEME